MIGRGSLTRLSLSARTLLRDPGATLLLVLLGALVGFGAAATPRFVSQTSDSALDNAAQEASAMALRTGTADRRIRCHAAAIDSVLQGTPRSDVSDCL